MDASPDTTGASTRPGSGATADNLHALELLISGIAAADRRAFEELYRLTSAKLFGVCLRILSRHSDAEEALQEAFLTIWHRAGTFDPERGSPMAWLVTLTRSRAIDRLRSVRSAEHGPPAGIADEIVTDAADHFDENVARQALVTCLDQLDRRDAGFIRAAFYEGRTYAELAASDNVPLGTVKTRIRRAFVRLRECLS